MTFLARRWRNIAVTTVVAAFLYVAIATYDAALLSGVHFSGWALLATTAVLAVHTVRKRVPMLPLGARAQWTQLHIYAGWLSVVLFVLHVGPRLPDGWLEGTLATLFAVVAGSGIVGLALSRRLPKRLSRRGEEVIFERIPAFRARLRNEAETLVAESASAAQSSTICDFYARRLAAFFAAPRNVAQHLLASNRGLFALLAEIDERRRYLSETERAYADSLRELVIRKDDLDFHFALQAALKGWLFVHAPLTYGLLIVSLVHLVLVYAFGGGLG